MDAQVSYNSENKVKISKEALDNLLEPIPNEILVEKVAQIKGWKSKKPPIAAKQSKREYLHQHFGRNLTLGVVRELRTLREHSSISKFNWQVFFWDRSIARYFPDKIKKKFENVILEVDSMVNIDLLAVDEPSQTIFMLLEQWQKEIVADTFLSKIETKIPKYFRIYLSIKKKMLLIQERNVKATEEFIKLFETAFNVKVEELRVNAMIIREFVKTYPENLTRLVVKVPQEVSGFSGLSELTVLGEDVIKGSKGLMDRHETSPIMVGPWVGVSNSDFDLNVGKSIRVRSIKKMLSFFDLMESL
ncbi:MAG: hypothetical protein HZR80_05345 [Candidatus Heimdallarchaeota archaeon]